MKSLLTLSFGLSLALTLSLAAPVHASILEIQFSGVDLTYNGSNLFDSGASNTVGQGMPSQADTLTSLTFLVDGVQVGSMMTSNIGLDLYVMGLANVPAAGGLVTTGGNSDAYGIDLLTQTAGNNAWGLALQIRQLSFFYTGGNIGISLVGQSSSLYSQSLPNGLAFDASQPISIALSSAKLTNVTTAGGFVTGFRSSGTGNISGTLLPEPGTMLLLAAGGLALARRKRS